MCLKFFANRLLVNIHDSNIIKMFQSIIIKQKGKIWMRMNCKQLMKWRLFGKEFRTYDTFDNQLFLVKQIAKFIRTPNVRVKQKWVYGKHIFNRTTEKSLKRLDF